MSEFEVVKRHSIDGADCWRRCATRSSRRSSATTTSASTAAAIPTA